MAKQMHSRGAFKRFFWLAVILLLGIVLHETFVYIEHHEFAAIILIAMLIGAMLNYYAHFIKERDFYRLEFFISIFVGLIATIFVFALIFSAPCWDDSCFLVHGVKQELDFSDALYFSTTTITTLGFGDIVPLEVFRYFVMIEVLLGIIYTGMIVYFFTRLHEVRK